MASMSRLALNSSTRLCFLKTSSTTSTCAFTTSLLGKNNNISLSNTITNTNNHTTINPSIITSSSTISSNNLNNMKKSIKTLKSAADITAALCYGSSAPKGASTFSSSGSIAVNPLMHITKSNGLQQIRYYSSLNRPLESQASQQLHQKAMAPLKNRRHVSSREITKNMTLYTSQPFKGEVDKNTLQFKEPTGNPLVVIMSWLLAKQKHLKKYAEIYTELGFDVMVCHITPWQLLWPAKGTQVVAAETLKFLENNKSYEPILLHGFSVGAYQFGEIMLQMSRDMERYSHILDRIICQVWDSAADITEIPVGLPKAIFPKNPRMENALRNYVLYHLKTFHNQATIHYMRSSQMFHSTLCKKPAIFFVSDNDLIGPPSSNQAVRENWERAGVKVHFKCWKHSQHTGHFIKHREEYLDLLFKHMEDCGVLEAIGVKQRAKL